MGRVRVTEGERERAIHSLRESYARGELDGEQFEEKLNALFAVQSNAELRELLPTQHGELAHVLASAAAATPTDLEAVERHLSPGEQVEWVGKPDPTRRFTADDKRWVPISLAICAFAIFWMVGAAEASGFFAVVGVPFLALSIYMALRRFFYKANRKQRTIYAVTNRRVLAVVRNWRGGGESLDAAYLRSIPNISTTALANGQGSVEFGLTSPASAEAPSGLAS
ncbi:MAG: DUF1707 domain-containing protein [Gaiellaceae bacterium]